MTDRVRFEYAVVRVVPRVDRGESINAGVLLWCREREFLGARCLLDTSRLAALDPAADVEGIEAGLNAVLAVARRRGDDATRRFGWLTAPRSTVVQPGPVHTGLTSDPQAELDRLFERLVLPTTYP
jgi:hypothetical protein